MRTKPEKATCVPLALCSYLFLFINAAQNINDSLRSNQSFCLAVIPI